MAESDNLEAAYRKLLSRLPWRTRASLWLDRQWRSFVRLLPGYRPITLVLWKAKRGGWGGIFDPPFDISKQDRAVYDRRLRWHGWGVLAEVGGFRAYCPTKRSDECFLDAAQAWEALERVYWGRVSDTAWTPLPAGQPR
jgi:hypothetical protein